MTSGSSSKNVSFFCTGRGFEEIGARSRGIGGSFLRAFPLRRTQMSVFLYVPMVSG